MSVLQKLGYAKRTAPLTFRQELALYGLKWLVGMLLLIAAAIYLAGWILDAVGM
jgi:hypothetical protein